MAVEAIAGYIRDNVALDMLGPKTGRKFSSFIGFLFFGVLSMNIAGIIPGINIAASFGRRRPELHPRSSRT